MNKRKQCRKKEMELKDNIDILQEEIDGKKKELEETLHQFNNRTLCAAFILAAKL
jgi:hypothetical protein